MRLERALVGAEEILRGGRLPAGVGARRCHCVEKVLERLQKKQ